MAEEKKDKGKIENNAALHKLAQEQKKSMTIQTGSIGRIEGLLSKISKNTESKNGGLLGGVKKVSVKKDTYKTDDFDPRESVKVLKSIEALLGNRDKKKEGFGITSILKGLLIGGIGTAIGSLLDMDDVKALGPVKVLTKMFGVYTKTIKYMDKVKTIISGSTLFTKVGKVFDSVKDFFKPVTKVIDGVKTMFKPITKLLGAGGKVAKIGGRLGLKALTKIPGLGLIAAVALSVPRFKKGDIIGGMMELASGAAAIFPGLVKTRLGKQAEGGLNSGISVAGQASSIMSKSGVDLNNLDFGPSHDNIDGLILGAYGKHLGKSYAPVITSARRTNQGNASLEESVKKSKHLTGNALDLRVNDIDMKTSNSITRSLAEALGKDFDVLQHGSGTNRHIHMEYDPKGKGYNSGGIVPGTSTIGDRVPARVNSGEMILNLAQQTKLFKIANGGGVDQNIPRVDIAAMNAKSNNMKEMMSFLTEKFAAVLSTKIAEATETAVKKRPKSSNKSMPNVDIT